MPNPNSFIHVTYNTLLGNHAPGSRTDSTYMSTLRYKSRCSGGDFIPPTLTQYRVQVNEHRLVFLPFHLRMPQDGESWTIFNWSERLSEQAARWTFPVINDLSILLIIQYSLNLWSEIVRRSGIDNHCKIDYIHTCNNRYRQEVYGAFFDHSILRLKNRSFAALKFALISDEYHDFWHKIIGMYDTLDFSYNLRNPRYVLRDAPNEPEAPQELVLPRVRTRSLPRASSRERIPDDVIPQNQLADMMLNMTLSPDNRNSIYDMLIQNQIGEVIEEPEETTTEEDIPRGERIREQIEQETNMIEVDVDDNGRITARADVLRRAILAARDSTGGWNRTQINRWNNLFNTDFNDNE